MARRHFPTRLLQLRGVRPFLSDKFDITKHKNYRYLSDSNPKYTFNIDRHIKIKLKVKPDEEYEYFEYVPPDEEMPEEAFEDFSDYIDFPEDLEIV
jgi:type IV secretion system protein VirD4